MLRWIRIQRAVKFNLHFYSTAKSSAVNVKVSVKDNNCKELINKEESPEQNEDVLEKSKLVAAAFASLKEIYFKSKYKNDAIWDRITTASDINSLLAVAESSTLSRQHALKIVSILANWATMGKITLADFESDTRFAKICQILGRVTGKSTNDDMADLSVVLGVTADEQAAKLISSVSLQQMIKILKSLSVKRRRSTPLLRSLAFNISRTVEKLNIKEASDALFAITSLNYPDEVLLIKLSENIRACLKENKNSAVVNSITLSMGKLRYRDPDLLDQLCLWILDNRTLCRTKDLFSLLFSLASVNYKPDNFPQFYKILKPYLKENEMIEIDNWIDVVWSLIILKECNENLIDSVLNPEFISKFISKKKNTGTNDDISQKFKLLNINGIAKQLGNAYQGHLLEEDSFIFSTPVLRNKEKQLFLDSIMEGYSNIIKVEDFIQTDINSRMGFLIDAVYLLDSKCEFVKLNSAQANENVTKIAIMANSYHDFCRGCSHEFTGVTTMNHRLLTGMGYKVISIPYTEYNSQDKLMTRVQYLNEKLKENVKA